LKEQANGIAGILPLLEKLKTASHTTPKLRVFNKERATDILTASLSCKNKIVYEIVSADSFQQTIGEKYHYTKRRVKAGVQLKSLRVRSQEIKKYNRAIHKRELREARFLPHELTFLTSVLFWDDTVAFFTSHQECLNWTIESASMRKMMEQIFDLLWSVSGTMETLVNTVQNKVQ